MLNQLEHNWNWQALKKGKESMYLMHYTVNVFCDCLEIRLKKLIDIDDEEQQEEW